MDRFLPRLIVCALVFLPMSFLAAQDVAPAGGEGAPEEAKPEAKKVEEAKKKPNLTHVSSKPLMVLHRFFELSEEQTKQRTALQSQYQQEYRKAIELAGKVLDEQYAEKILAVLTEEQKAEFGKVREALKAHEEARKAAEEEYTKLYAEMGGTAMVRVPYSQQHLAYQIPGLTAEERKAAQTATSGVYRQQYQEINRVLKEKGINKPGRQDRDGRQKYSRAMQEVRAEVTKKNSEAVQEKILGALSPESAANYKKLSAALASVIQKREELQSQLAEQLEAIIGTERLQPKSIQWQGRTQGAGGRPVRFNYGH